MESYSIYHVNLFSYLVSEGYKSFYQSLADFQLREDATQEDQNGQEGCSCHAQFLLANGDT